MNTKLFSLNFPLFAHNTVTDVELLLQLVACSKKVTEDPRFISKRCLDYETP